MFEQAFIIMILLTWSNQTSRRDSFCPIKVFLYNWNSFTHLKIGLLSKYIGGFQLEFVSISRVIDHITCYKFECSHWWIFLQDLLSNLNAIISTNESTEFITDHVIYNQAYTYKFQLKTTIIHCIKNWKPSAYFQISNKLIL